MTIARLARAAQLAIVAVLPALLAVLLLAIVLDRSLGDYAPSWSDETSYWHQIATARVAGLDGGHYTYEEQEPRWGSRFGAWGPFYPLLLGTLAKVTGWNAAMPPRYGLALFTLGLGIALAIARPPWRRLLLLAVVLCTFWPLLLALPTGMQEPLHYAFAVLLAALFARLVDPAHEHADGARPKSRRWMAVTAVIILATLMRPVWAFGLLAVAVLATRDLRRRTRVAALTGALAAIGVLFVVVASLAAPYPYPDNPATLLEHADGPADALNIMRATLAENWRVTREAFPRFETNVSITAGLAALSAAFIAALLLSLRSRGRAASLVGWQGAQRGQDLAVLVGMLVLPVAMHWTTYNLLAGTRHLGPHLLLATTYLCLRARRGLLLVPAAVIVAMIMSVGNFLADMDTLQRSRFAAVETSGLESVGLKYVDGAPPWCNTLLVATDPPFFPAMISVPAGFGISVSIAGIGTLEPPLKSRYVLLDGTSEHRLRTSDHPLDELARTRFGTLYENPAASC